MTPPPSQSAKANGLVGLANTNTQISVPESIALVQSSDASRGSSPVAHSSALLTPPPSQSNDASGWDGSALIRLQIVTFWSMAASQSSEGSNGSSPASHSVTLIMPPPSQSSMDSMAEGFVASIAHRSNPANSTAIHSSL